MRTRNVSVRMAVLSMPVRVSADVDDHRRGTHFVLACRVGNDRSGRWLMPANLRLLNVSDSLRVRVFGLVIAG